MAGVIFHAVVGLDKIGVIWRRQILTQAGVVRQRCLLSRMIILADILPDNLLKPFGIMVCVS